MLLDIHGVRGISAIAWFAPLDYLIHHIMDSYSLYSAYRYSKFLMVFRICKLNLTKITSFSLQP